jgi:hypothetical protein
MAGWFCMGKINKVDREKIKKELNDEFNSFYE